MASPINSKDVTYNSKSNMVIGKSGEIFPGV